MDLPHYFLEFADNLNAFEFISDGPNGKIRKLIRYSKTNIDFVYNLAFGDMNVLTGEINDLSKSNNGDSEKILTTVAQTIYAFTKKYPESYIYIRGSTKSRTRLYQMGISKYQSDIKESFEIYGEINNIWESFRQGINYESFLVKRKSLT